MATPGKKQGGGSSPLSPTTTARACCPGRAQLWPHPCGQRAEGGSPGARRPSVAGAGQQGWPAATPKKSKGGGYCPLHTRAQGARRPPGRAQGRRRDAGGGSPTPGRRRRKGNGGAVAGARGRRRKKGRKRKRKKNEKEKEKKKEKKIKRKRRRYFGGLCGGGIFGEKEKENIEEKGVDGENGEGKKRKIS